MQARLPGVHQQLLQSFFKVAFARECTSKCVCAQTNTVHPPSLRNLKKKHVKPMMLNQVSTPWPLLWQRSSGNFGLVCVTWKAKPGPTPAEDKTPGSPGPSHRREAGAALPGSTPKTPFPWTRKKLIQFETSLPNKDREQKKCFRKLKKSFIRLVKERPLLHS